MPFAEEEHPVGDLGAGGEHEPFRVSAAPPPVLVLFASLLGYNPVQTLLGPVIPTWHGPAPPTWPSAASSRP